jgi:hypothetical protein
MLGLLKVHKTGHWSMHSGGLSHTPLPPAGQGMHPASPVYKQFTLKPYIMKKLILLSAVLVSSLVSLAGDTPVHHPHPHGFSNAYHPRHEFSFGPAAYHHGFTSRVRPEPVNISLALPDFRTADAEISAQADAGMGLLADYRFVDFSKADAEIVAQAKADEIILPGYRTIDFTRADGDMIASVEAPVR